MHQITTYLYTHPALIGLVSFLIGLSFMPVVLKVAQTKHLVVKPNKRMSHTGEVPNIGGIDIFMSFILSYLLFEYDRLQYSQFIFIGIFIILMVGFVDDMIDIHPYWKLLGEIIAGVFLLVFANIRITNLHGFLGIWEIPLLASLLLSFFVFIVIINALNLIDGVDGLASGLGIIYSLFFAIYFYLVHEIHLTILTYCLIGSLAVFFLYNVFGGTKRKIFMGDSGSLVLGYMITLFVFEFCEMNAYHQVPEIYHMNAAPAVAICILTIPLFDTIRVMLTRIKKGKSPFKPDKNHIHHLLLKTGLTHVQTTVILLFTTVCFIGLGLWGRNWPIWLLVCVTFILCCLFIFILWKIVDKTNAK